MWSAHRDRERGKLFFQAQIGYIYKGSYTGQYCVFDELYVDSVGPGAPCPECGRPTETVSEENYFFKLRSDTSIKGPTPANIVFSTNSMWIRSDQERLVRNVVGPPRP